MRQTQDTTLLLLMSLLLLSLRCRVRANHALPEVAVLMPLFLLPMSLLLPCASKSRLARARCADATVAVADVPAAAQSALPGASKSRVARGRCAGAPVAVADVPAAAQSALPG